MVIVYFFVIAFTETRAYALFQTPDFLNLSESMVQLIMCRNLEIPEVRKFEAMLAWTKNKVISSKYTYTSQSIILVDILLSG